MLNNYHLTKLHYKFQLLGQLLHGQISRRQKSVQQCFFTPTPISEMFNDTLSGNLIVGSSPFFFYDYFLAMLIHVRILTNFHIGI